jgi:hypothetical protein
MDNSIQESLSELLNVKFDKQQLSQASLLVSLGGLGVRSVQKLSLPAYLASAISTNDLTKSILQRCELVDSNEKLNLAIDEWKDVSGKTAMPINRSNQKEWDLAVCETIRDNLLETTDVKQKARLLAV